MEDDRQTLANLAELLAQQESALARLRELQSVGNAVPDDVKEKIEAAMAKIPRYEAEVRRIRQQMKNIDERLAKLHAQSKKLETRKKAALEDERRTEEKLRAKETH